MLARAPAPPPPLPPPRPVVLSGPSSRLDRTCTSCPLCKMHFCLELVIASKPTYRDPLSFSSLGHIALRFHFSSASPRGRHGPILASGCPPRGAHGTVAEADAGLPSTGAAAPLAAPQVLASSTPAGPPRPPRWPVRAPSLWEPGNAGYSPRPVGCGADGRSPLRVRPQLRARVCRVPRAALASAHVGHPSARARPAPHTLRVRADPDRYRPAPPRLATGSQWRSYTLASTNRGIAGGTPSPPARPRLPSSRTSLPRGGPGPSRSHSVRRTPNTMATPPKPGLTPKRAARPPYGGHASRSTGTPKRPAPLTVFPSNAASAAQRQGQARACNTHHLIASPPPPATVQLAASPKLRLPAGLHIVGLPRRPNLSQPCGGALAFTRWIRAQLPARTNQAKLSQDPGLLPVARRLCRTRSRRPHFGRTPASSGKG